MSAPQCEMTLMITTESLAFGTFVVDDTHRIVSWNEAATRMLGYDADATLGRTYEEIVALLHAQDVRVCPNITDATALADVTDALGTSYMHQINPRSFQQREIEPVQIQVVTSYGTKRWLNLNIFWARSLDGSDCVVHLFRDVTEHTEKQRQGEAAAQVSRHRNTILRLPVESPESAGDDHHLKMTPERLTPREHEVLELLAKGMATIEIATALGISRVTARNHVTRVIEKLGVKTRLQAVLAASRLQLI